MDAKYVTLVCCPLQTLRLLSPAAEGAAVTGGDLGGREGTVLPKREVEGTERLYQLTERYKKFIGLNDHCDYLR